MPYNFTPPTTDGNHWDALPEHPGHKLFRHYNPIPEGVTVWKDQNGEWHQSTYPHQGGQEFATHDWDQSTYSEGTPGLDDAVHVFLGGHQYVVDDDVAAELIAAGYTPTPI